MGFRPSIGALLVGCLALFGRPGLARAEEPPKGAGPAKAESDSEERADEIVKEMLADDADHDDLAWLYSNADEYSPSGLTGDPIAGDSVPTRGGGTRREWDPHWRKFGTGNYVLTFTGFAVGLGSFLVPPSKTPWRGRNSLDEWGVRTLGASSYEAGRTAQDTSDVLASLTIAYPFLVDSLIVSYWYRRSPEVATQISLITLEAVSVAELIQGPTAALTSRERPYGRDCGKGIPSNHEDCAGSDRYRSFYSGHTTVSFVAATVTCSHHLRHDLFGDASADGMACGAALASAATVGTMRIVGNKHYVTDVLAGAGIGTLTGLGVPWLLHYGPLARIESSRATGSIELTLLPLPGGLAAGGTF
jgi:hypothetical protein